VYNGSWTTLCNNVFDHASHAAAYFLPRSGQARSARRPRETLGSLAGISVWSAGTVVFCAPLAMGIRMLIAAAVNLVLALVTAASAGPQERAG